MISQEVTFKEFEEEYIGNNKLKPKSCLPTCVEEVCGGCNISLSPFNPRVSGNLQTTHPEAHKKGNEPSSTLVRQSRGYGGHFE
jgi:hypothetical protein